MIQFGIDLDQVVQIRDTCAELLVESLFQPDVIQSFSASEMRLISFIMRLIIC